MFASSMQNVDVPTVVFVVLSWMKHIVIPLLLNQQRLLEHSGLGYSFARSTAKLVNAVYPVLISTGNELRSRGKILKRIPYLIKAMSMTKTSSKLHDKTVALVV